MTQETADLQEDIINPSIQIYSKAKSMIPKLSR